eukprot:418254-Pleurochrysis_carterae.AAC.1
MRATLSSSLRDSSTASRANLLRTIRRRSLAAVAPARSTDRRAAGRFASLCSPSLVDGAPPPQNPSALAFRATRFH